MTDSNTTGVISDSADSIVDILSGSPELAALGLVAVGAGVYAYMKVPAVRIFVDKLYRKHEAEIDALVDTHLTKLQKKTYDALSDEVRKNVRNDILANVILSTWDQHDDKLVKQVRNTVREALSTNK
jgi:O-acetyl-ADP-ribose deacetylase (regulator of RNase III)